MIANNPTNRQEWLEARMNGIGASEAAAITLPAGHPHKPRWGNRLSVWAEKCGLAEHMEEPEDGPLFWGKFLEQPIKDKFSATTGRKLRGLGDFEMFWDAECPAMFATPDEIIEEIAPEQWSLPVPFPGGPGVLEVKNVGAWSASDWEEGSPANYTIQGQQQLACTGLKWGSFAVLIGGQRFVWLDFVRHDGLIKNLRRSLGSFWKLVERRTPPSPDDGDEATVKALCSMYPKDSGASVPLPNEAWQWDDAIAKAEEQIKEAEALKEKHRALIRAAIKDATIGVLPDGTRWSWKANKNGVRTLRRMSSEQR